MKDFFKKLFGKEWEKMELELKKEKEQAEEPSILQFLNSEYLITDVWLDLFTHFILLDRHNKMPLKTWYAETSKLIHNIGEEEFISVGSKWISDCIEKSKENQRRYSNIGDTCDIIQKNIGYNNNRVPGWVKKVYGDDIIKRGFIRMQRYMQLNNFQNYFYQSLGGRILRGFLHSTIINKDLRFVELVDQIAIANPNTSQDVIYVYSKLPADISIPRLMKLKSKVKNKNILSRINTAITAVGKSSGKTKSEIEESAIPDLGLSNIGHFIKIINDVQCIFEMTNSKDSTTFYLLKNGKKQKTLPKILKENFKSEIKQFKKQIKDIKSAINSNKKRIEEFYLTDRSIPYASFIEHYFENNLIKVLAKNLIWNFQDKDININLLKLDSKFCDCNGVEYKKNLQNCQVSLWHPIDYDSNYIMKWRSLILKNEIFQPFKQAFREIYIITDAELKTETYSNRFASHILNKNHVAALCKVRGWSPSGMNNGGKATYRLPQSDYKAEYRVGDIYIGEETPTYGEFGSYGSAHIATDQVRFYKKKEQLFLANVPPILFSEVMRDVDMFVGVTSIGNDPEWFDRGDDATQNYWSTYTNGELTERSKTRSEILKNLIPKMKIAEQCEFDGRYLKVKGTLRNYKIHMGSGNILMEPNDQYLCIVASRSRNNLNKLFIPFESDNMLSIIISKAILLANDSKIDNPSIISQISRK